MSRIIVTAAPAYGHFSPMRAIAADLVRRGHHVTVLTAGAFKESAERTGAEFRPLTGSADDVPYLLGSPERLALPGGMPRREWDLRHLVVGLMADQHRDLQRATAEAGDEPVLAVSDVGFQGAAPLMSGAPGPRPTAFIGIGTVPLALGAAETAPLPHERPLDAAQALFLSELAALGARTETAPFFLEATTVGADRFLHLGIEELSHRGGGLPEHLSFVGTLPAFRPAGNRLPDWWADVESAETVVVVTQGTSPNQDFSRLIEPALEALAGLPVLVVATTGREGRVRAVPANARVAAFIPFDDLLPHTDVLVTNGGFGGVQHALRLGTPVVLAGQDEDGPRGNAHVAATGAAIAIAGERPDAMSIRKAVETVLTTADFRRNAERLAAEHAGLDALDAIARTVDELTGG